jgi:hypothetical protein
MHTSYSVAIVRPSPLKQCMFATTMVAARPKRCVDCNSHLVVLCSAVGLEHKNVNRDKICALPALQYNIQGCIFLARARGFACAVQSLRWRSAANIQQLPDFASTRQSRAKATVCQVLSSCAQYKAEQCPPATVLLRNKHFTIKRCTSAAACCRRTPECINMCLGLSMLHAHARVHKHVPASEHAAGARQSAYTCACV